jgi:Fe-S oxidoreductase
VPQCPVKIDIPWLNEVLHQRLSEKEKSPYSFIFKRFLPKDTSGENSTLQKLFLGNFYHFAKWGTHFSSASNKMQNAKLVRILMEKYLGISLKRKLPVFADKTLSKKVQSFKFSSERPDVKRKVLFFPDIYTNYLYPERGIAVIELFKKLGINLTFGEVMPDGRAALSQGLITTAAKRAKKTTKYLDKWIDRGYDIIVIEPSVLAMFRRDYNHLIKDEKLFTKLKNHCYEPFEYLQKIFADDNLEADQLFDISKLPAGTKLFYHSHCQQKTMGAADQTADLFRKLGLIVAESQVECCGMAGSFGYKKDFYEVSMKDAEDLFNQIKSEGDKNNVLVLASGISCKDQISEGLGYKVIHPVELLSKMLIY